MESNNLAATIKMFMKCQVDLINGPEMVVISEAQKLDFKDFLNQVRILTPPLNVNKIHLAISLKSKNYMDKINAFNKGLEFVKSKGILNKILKEYSFSK